MDSHSLHFQLAPKSSHIFNHSLTTSTLFTFADDNNAAALSSKNIITLPNHRSIAFLSNIMTASSQGIRKNVILAEMTKLILSPFRLLRQYI